MSSFAADCRSEFAARGILLVAPGVVDHGERPAALGRHASAAARPAGAGGDRRLSQGRVDPSDRQPQAPAGALAVPVRDLQRPHPAGHADRRGLLGLDGDLGGLLRAPARPALPCRDVGVDLGGEDRRRSSGSTASAIWSPTARRSTRPPSGSRPNWAASTSTSSPMPSGRPTGAATTTSPNRSSSR